MKFEGIYPPVITPFNDDYSIDYQGFEKMIEYLIDSSAVHGIIVGGTTGESYALTREERVEMMGVAREVIRGRLPMIVGIGAIRTEDCIDYGLAARDFPHITLLCGMDDQALEFFAWGARGWVAAGANCLPKEHDALYRAVALENDIVKGRQIMSALMPFMRILEQGGKLIQIVKYACELQGLPAGTVRRPLRPLFKSEKRELEMVLRTLKYTMASITGETQPSGKENVVAINT